MPFGVDEAGKGPALGSMFAAAVHLEEPAVLPDGIADSKRLSPSRRDALAETIREDDRISVGVAEVPPERIDDPETDMNSLTVRAHAAAIEDALADVAADDRIAGLCDACDTDADRFARRVADACGPFEGEGTLEVDARHGADDDSPLVGAASIVAKVERDAHVAAIADEYGDVGSGYPGDSTTREFLSDYVAEHGELPPFARSSWSTCEELLAEARQTDLGQF
ncbi:ribonuclease HII [Halobiforma lacisalsi AJ5]|uniref:Ribonuclease HII n=1 Tax=Natronobacterium lacisalsi AJ5 TaxID=358396 RepID=M0LFD6_NATLA|nr:ribonuclease HII [Halobiforma lacisalsi]APW96416.1 ribonuclease HII [Halobiforma lacisalsi AJ5]EMA31813.1 ribonuclease HII [Halobiforma lacisalsi AJ5]